MRPQIIAAGTLAAIATFVQTVDGMAQPAAAAVVSSAADSRLSLPAPKAGRSQPLIVVVAENAGAETTDFTIPYGVLKASGVADVRSLSTGPGPVQLRMALRIMADQTLAEFAASEPAGADVVIVPAQVAPKDPELTAWIRAQAAKGAIVVSVCEGARVLAHAGLLDGRRAVTHWSAINGLAKAYPSTMWVRDRRYLQDGPVISTTGVTASIPVSLALVEAIGGRSRAEATARRFGVAHWGAAHRTGDFEIRKTDIVRTAAGALSRETVEAPISDGVDEVALALRTDAWTRSYRTTVATTHAGRRPVRSQHGLTILPDEEAKAGRYVIPGGAGPAVPQLDLTLDAMGRRYGATAVRMAVMGMEYDRPGARGR